MFNQIKHLQFLVILILIGVFFSCVSIKTSDHPDKNGKTQSQQTDNIEAELKRDLTLLTVDFWESATSESIKNKLEIPVELDIKDNRGQTPLFLALIHCDDPEVIKLLLEAGAETNIFNAEGHTPLTSMLLKFQVENIKLKIQYLLQYSNPNLYNPANGMTPLAVAVNTQDDEEIIKLFIDAGADVNFADDRNGWSPLTRAARYTKNPNVLKALLNAGANVNHAQFDGITSLTTTDGRVTIMMPHPERVFRTVANSWHPDSWGEDSPWVRMFRNARKFTG